MFCSQRMTTENRQSRCLKGRLFEGGLDDAIKLCLQELEGVPSQKS